MNAFNNLNIGFTLIDRWCNSMRERGAMALVMDLMASQVRTTQQVLLRVNEDSSEIGSVALTYD